MTEGPQTIGAYVVRHATPDDLTGARSVMLDTFYRVFDYGYVPDWHTDVVALEQTYLDDPRHALFVAALGTEITATACVNSRGLRHPPHPEWLADRYPAGSTAQLMRVYVRPEHRRHGLARALVGMACDFAATVPGYHGIYLHTDVKVPGAEPFWRSLATEVFDARTTGEHGSGFQTVHFEIPMPTRQ